MHAPPRAVTPRNRRSPTGARKGLTHGRTAPPAPMSAPSGCNRACLVPALPGLRAPFRTFLQRIALVSPCIGHERPRQYLGVPCAGAATPRPKVLRQLFKEYRIGDDCYPLAD